MPLNLSLCSHALQTACELALRQPRLARDIARRILASPLTDEQTARAASALHEVLR